MRKYTIYIGIDTGVKTGIAIWDAKLKRFLTVETLKIHQAMNFIRERNGIAPTLVRVEDARQRKWFGNADERMERSGAGIREGIGSVKRDAGIWEDFLSDLGIPFELVPPRKNKTKMKSPEFKRLTGWEHDTNEHGRDAAMLVFGY